MPRHSRGKPKPASVARTSSRAPRTPQAPKKLPRKRAKPRIPKLAVPRKPRTSRFAPPELPDIPKNLNDVCRSSSCDFEYLHAPHPIVSRRGPKPKQRCR